MGSAPVTKISPRSVVGALGGAAAVFAFSVGAVSLTRIAGDYLGFPDGFAWTLTGASDVAGVAGGIMWTAFRGNVRGIGRAMNIVCTIVSGIGVGLDHATHSGKVLGEADHAPIGDAQTWSWIAFLVGFFLPLLVTWILHGLAVMADHLTDAGREGAGIATPLPATVATPTETPLAASVETHDEVPARDPGREPAVVAATLVATTGTPHREAPPAGSRDGDDTGPLPRIQLAQDPAQPRPTWMSDDLIEAVAQSIRDTPGGRTNYGVPSVSRDHTLPGGGRIGSHRAGQLLDRADERVRSSA